MELKVEICRLSFEDLSVKEKLEFITWLLKHPKDGGYQDFVEFAQLVPNERKVFGHAYRRLLETHE